MIVKIGKHYINIDELSHIEYASVERGGVLLEKYVFHMKNTVRVDVDKESFDKFFDKYRRTILGEE